MIEEPGINFWKTSRQSPRGSCGGYRERQNCPRQGREPGLRPGFDVQKKEGETVSDRTCSDVLLIPNGVKTRKNKTSEKRRVWTEERSSEGKLEAQVWRNCFVSSSGNSGACLHLQFSSGRLQQRSKVKARPGLECFHAAQLRSGRIHQREKAPQPQGGRYRLDVSGTKSVECVFFFSFRINVPTTSCGFRVYMKTVAPSVEWNYGAV